MMVRSGFSKRLGIAGLAAFLTLAAGTQMLSADDTPAPIDLSDSLAALSGQAAKSASGPSEQLALIRGRLDNTRGVRAGGRNLNSSTLAMRFSGGSVEKSAAFETKHLLGPEKERRTRRTAVWFGGDVTLDSARAEDPRRSTVYSNGVAFGADMRLGQRFLMGNAVGMAFDRSRLGSGGSLESLYLSNTLYGSLTTSPETYLDVALGGSRSDFLSHYSDIGALPGGRRSSSQFFGQTRFSHKLERDQVRIRSYGQARFQRTNFGDYREEGEGGHLCMQQSSDSLEFMFGMRGEVSRGTRAGKVTPHVVLEVSRALKRSSGALVISMDGGVEDHVVRPSSSQSGRLAARTGLNWAITDYATIDGEYSLSSAMAEFAPQQKVAARFKLRF